METCKVCNLRKYKDEQTSTKSFQYAYDWPNVKRRIEYQKSQRRNYFGYKILARPVDRLIDCRSGLFVGLAIEFPLHVALHHLTTTTAR